MNLNCAGPLTFGFPPNTLRWLLYNPVNIPENTKFYSLTGWTEWYVNCISKRWKSSIPISITYHLSLNWKHFNPKQKCDLKVLVPKLFWFYRVRLFKFYYGIDYLQILLGNLVYLYDSLAERYHLHNNEPIRKINCRNRMR